MGPHENKPSIALVNSGGIWQSICVGNITRMDMFGMLPMNNTIDLITLSGIDLKLVLEESASRLKCVTNSNGVVEVEGGEGFLQVSGMSIMCVPYCPLFRIYANNVGVCM